MTSILFGCQKKIARSVRFCRSEQKFLAKTVENVFLRRKGMVILGTENRYQRKLASLNYLAKSAENGAGQACRSLL
jgi:hypothetical protein